MKTSFRFTILFFFLKHLKVIIKAKQVVEVHGGTKDLLERKKTGRKEPTEGGSKNGLEVEKNAL